MGEVMFAVRGGCLRGGAGAGPGPDPVSDLVGGVNVGAGDLLYAINSGAQRRQREMPHRRMLLRSLLSEKGS